MAFYFGSWFTELYFCLFVGLFTYYLYFKMVASKYWKNRNIPSAEPVIFLGNIWKSNILETLNASLAKLYKNWKKEKLVGFWSFSSPILLVIDISIIKNILERDFSHFQDHSLDVDPKREPLSGHLFNLKGTKWRNLRVKLTPTFTSGKMKMMFPTVMKCAEELQDCLKKLADEKKEVEVKEILARYTTDVIGSCAFGIETNSLKNPNAEFRQYARKVFEPTPLFLISNLIFNIWPKLYHLLKLRTIPEYVANFFFKTVKDTMEYREKNKVKRNDFMELLIQLKNKGKLEDAEGIIPTIEPVRGEEESFDADMKITMNDAAAQAFVFFFAGFETSSTTLTFALYELAMNVDVQKKLQKEIDDLLVKQNGQPTYEGIMELEYLDWVLQETLRKYPPVPVLLRECTKDYKIPELNAKIDKKCVVFIPIMAIHRDPEIYPNPDTFDPLRFSPEEKAKRDRFTFLTFGEGPRICIGSRFAFLQSKVGLFLILSRFNVMVSSRTPSPLTYDPQSFILAPKGGMNLNFTERKK